MGFKFDEDSIQEAAEPEEGKLKMTRPAPLLIPIRKNRQRSRSFVLNPDEGVNYRDKIHRVIKGGLLKKVQNTEEVKKEIQVMKSV